jgi:nucleoside 2-deoxyribosyltransferase
MPFKKEMDDVFYYGIQQSVRASGFICERIDRDAFTGDILDQVKKKIETATVVIAELSGANPNVYLEIGYAWGKGRPTILLIKNDQDLLFDVRGQRCLKYERIRDLEESLKNELKELIARGLI